MSALDKYVLDEAGRPVAEPDLLRWARWFEKSHRQRVLAHTKADSDVSVSTVFLGINHRFSGCGSPVLWETMIFGGPHDGDMWRYDSREAALAGHAAAVELAKAAYGSTGE